MIVHRSNDADRHYTPRPIAAEIASILDIGELVIPTVADFAAGTGALLEAVEERFRTATCVATDVDRRAIAHLRANHPHWRVGRCDFLNPRSLARSPIVRTASLSLDAAVLNPPFSCRGSHRVVTSVLGAEIPSGVAMAFILRAFDCLARNGQLVALLPAGCLLSEKDDIAWRILSQHAAVTVVKEFGRGEFDGAFARTVLVHLRRGAPTNAVHRPSGGERRWRSERAALTLHRGRFPVHRLIADSPGYPLVHTTHLHDGTVTLQSRHLGPMHLGIGGPLLLVPRVGLPLSRKIVLYRPTRRIVVSDCIFALAGPRSLLEGVQQIMLDRWDLFRSRYGGSCAPFITTRALLAFLTDVGLDVQIERRLVKTTATRFATTHTGD